MLWAESGFSRATAFAQASRSSSSPQEEPSRAAHHEIVGRLRRSNGSRFATYAIDVIATSAHSVGVFVFSNLIESFSSIENISFEWKKEQWSIQVGILVCRGWVALGCPQPPALDSLGFSRLNNLCRVAYTKFGV